MTLKAKSLVLFSFLAFNVFDQRVSLAAPSVQAKLIPTQIEFAAEFNSRAYAQIFEGYPNLKDAVLICATNDPSRKVGRPVPNPEAIVPFRIQHPNDVSWYIYRRYSGELIRLKTLDGVQDVDGRGWRFRFEGDGNAISQWSLLVLRSLELAPIFLEITTKSPSGAKVGGARIVSSEKRALLAVASMFNTHTSTELSSTHPTGLFVPVTYRTLSVIKNEVSQIEWSWEKGVGNSIRQLIEGTSVRPLVRAQDVIYLGHRTGTRDGHFRYPFIAYVRRDPTSKERGDPMLGPDEKGSGDWYVYDKDTLLWEPLPSLRVERLTSRSNPLQVRFQINPESSTLARSVEWTPSASAVRGYRHSEIPVERITEAWQWAASYISERDINVSINFRTLGEVTYDAGWWITPAMLKGREQDRILKAQKVLEDLGSSASRRIICRSLVSGPMRGRIH